MWKKENLRKNFLRVKQIADQNLGRAERSEVLTEDQQGIEKRVEVVRQVCHSLIKKVTALLETQPGPDVEKRLKKMPETSLSNVLIESATLLGADTLLGKICQQCGECQGSLAHEQLEYELDIEREVLGPLQVIEETDIPSIMKHRKHLNKSTLDMDSAKNRYNSAYRQIQAQGANLTSAKVDAVRDEYDEACNKVELIKDNLSIELCNFIAKENEHSSRFVALLESQAAYHRKALQVIESTIPKMKATIEASEAKPVFGLPLEEHLRIMGRDISVVLEVCIMMLLETGMEEEGLFRIGGGALKLRKLKSCFDAHSVDMEEFSSDPHTVAGVLKQYLRELPEPLLTFELHSEFMQAIQLPQDQRFKALYTAVNKLPPVNYKNVRYLVKFLALLAEKSHINKMTPSNIAIVVGPNLLWGKGESAPNMLTTGTVSSIVEAFIVHADHFFPGEFDFHLTRLGCAPPSPSISGPTDKESSLVSSTRSLDEADMSQKEEELEKMSAFQPREENMVQLATWETREALNTSPDSISLDQESESSGEIVLSGSGAEITFAMMDGLHPDSPGQERHISPNSIMSVSSPCVMTHPPAAGNRTPPSNNAGSAEKSLSPTAESPDSLHINPNVQRRPSKKPAPPPPPPQERPYSVAVTASVSGKGPGNGGQCSQTWPRNSMLISPEAAPNTAIPPGNAGNGERHHSHSDRRPSLHDRPSVPPPERPNIPPPDRPKGPPPAHPANQQPSASSGGHQRSASTGAMYITTEAGPSSGSSSNGNFQGGMGSSLTIGHGNTLPSGTNTLGRHSSMRPARPNPPPPPPPVNLETEETRL